MFKMQTDNHNFKNNFATDNKKYSEKNEFEVSKFRILHLKQNSIFYVFCYKLELFEVKWSIRHEHKWLNKIVCFNFLKN